jgi:hypothetical protein
MPGFEFLTVVRKRVPHIPIIATGGEYSAGAHPPRILADSLLQKGQYTVEGLLEEIKKLLVASRIRAVDRKRGTCCFLRAQRPCAISHNHLPEVPFASDLEASYLGIDDITCPSCGTTCEL